MSGRLRPDERALRWASGVLVAFLVLGLVLVVASWLSHRGDAVHDVAGSTPAAQTTPTADTVAPTPTTSPSATTGRAAMTGFLRSYLRDVTRDPRAGWSRLTPGFQRASGGYDAYAAFWGPIREARPSGVFADPATRRVTYAVTYTYDDGHVDTDSTRIVLVRDGEDYRIAGEG